MNTSQSFSACVLANSLQSCLTLCNPMNGSTPGLPVHHQLLEFTQTHVHWVGDAIQPSHPLSSPSPTLNLSQHQGLFQWVGSSCQMVKVLELKLHIRPSNQYSGLISFRIDWFDLLAIRGTLKSLLKHQIQKHQFFVCQPLWSNTHICAWELEKPYLSLYGCLSAKWCLCFLIYCLGLS